MQDVITDLVAFASEAVRVANIPNTTVHEGMLSTAKYLLKKLTGYSLTTGRRTVTEDVPLLDIAMEKLRTQVGDAAAKVCV